VSRTIAISVGMQAIEEEVAPVVTREELENKIQANFWIPKYRDYRRQSF
jgi:malate dehydrogenase (oxaloacetate-decarboxylating)